MHRCTEPHDWISALLSVLKPLILFPPGTPCFYFGLGPTNYVASPPSDFSTGVLIVHFTFGGCSHSAGFLYILTLWSANT